MIDVERRKLSQRVQFSAPRRVRILAIDGTWFRDAGLVDVSDQGAQLEIDGWMTEAKEFFLMLSFNHHPAFRRCKLVWLNGQKLGVTFERQNIPDPEAKRQARGRRATALPTPPPGC